MAKTSLWQVSVSTSPQAEEAVAALLELLFEQPPVIQTNAQTGATRVSVYLKQRADCSSSTLAEVRRELIKIKDCGIELGSGKVALKKIPFEDWAQSWKKHFPPIEIGSALLIKPPWIKRKARPNQAVVVLNPGLSFGTGQHPTTHFCLAQLVAWRKMAPNAVSGPPSCLDIGTGSGILAIAAYKLGYRPVEAFDFDPEAVRIARRNGIRNKVKVNFSCGDITSGAKQALPGYDVVCANLTSDLLLDAKAAILDTLKTPGVLILAGLLRTQFTAVRESYERSGLKFICSKTEKEWKSGAFLRR